MASMSLSKSIIGLVLLCLTACTAPADEHGLRTGDIVFRSAGQSDLSAAIDDVTQTSKGTNYTHMGILQQQPSGNVMVIHADLGKGVVRESLDQFRGDQVVDVYRTDLPQGRLDSILFLAENWLGQPYNQTYRFDDEGMYCSELVYIAFADDSVFTLEPMTFMNQQTGKIHDNWIAHYEELGIAVPEGEPGCNPNGMATCTRLRFIKTIKGDESL